MDLTFTEQQDAFRQEVRAWLEENRPVDDFEPYYTPTGLAQYKDWERSLIDAGYSAPGWPKEYGGLGLDLWGQLIYDEEYARLNLPERINKMGLLHGGPTVMAHGTEEQKAKWLPDLLDNTHIWCQGFSEPDAGSDLAALRTTGRIEGENLILNGQKTWTSFGVIATKMFALVRTDPAAAKHRGISFVVLDLDTPGVEVRPLRQLHGHAGFAEVFFTDAAVPLANVVGPLGEGWRIAQTSLQLERGTGRGVHTRLEHALNEVTHLARRDLDSASMERLGSLKAWTSAFAHASYALTDAMSRGEEKTADASVLKLRQSEIQTAIREEQLALLGGDAELISDVEPDAPLPTMLREYWHSRAGEIFAGTTQIQKNIIAEAGLGLPREPRP
ncbi:acyl-CoA dehydrogenase family protein [Microbacterium profundi]|uniref:Acyl-CoA dehydrogenase family protein n=1 Tax=Microbacterium profundi TaxID=450380 RepID=A0ABV3LD54_9MICO